MTEPDPLTIVETGPRPLSELLAEETRVLRPGDTLIIRISPDRNFTPQDRENMRLMVQSHAPAAHVVVVRADELVIQRG
jgi:hypothetical protein